MGGRFDPVWFGRCGHCCILAIDALLVSSEVYVYSYLGSAGEVEFGVNVLDVGF